jgi:phosphosulfolactate phosphohydrolase-like enzyme
MAMAVNLTLALTVRFALPCMLEAVAVIVATPAATPVATPVASMDATAALEDFHCADVVRSFVVPSEKCPVAVKGCLAPAFTDVEDGLTTTEVKLAVGLLTVRFALPCMFEAVAVMVATPAVTPLATPVASMDATAALEDFHCADVVRSFVVPSEKCPVAVKGCLAPALTDVEDGLTTTEVSDAF